MCRSTLWVKRAVLTLAAVAALTGTGWADPAGSANVPQVLLGLTANPSPVSFQLTFLTTEAIAFGAAYYDPNPACAGLQPLFAELFVFNLEGLFLNQFPATTTPLSAPFSSKYRELSATLPPGALPPGGYKFTFLVRSCNDAISVILPELLTFRVVTP
jgi:hypothetical protein